ncbi:hypothetical protein CO731_01514 [Aminobacter sp. MSH1]|uniref:hypothetical protein n=1 Tax=Aminobacter sp. MSH1 TaxID=374606 RepID=UPI000D378A6A|nr:hypothetical protein [Aminobacter sp. MSH1]AWC22058.1 hypothetical protein CO731_01514 [Aminobacter sp. MSH1]
MSNKFSMVSPAVWWSKRFRALPTSDAKLLYHYFLTSERQNSAGCFQAREGHVLSDMDWTAAAYYPSRQALIDADLVAFDAETETVYVKRWFKHCPPMNPNHARGTRKLIEAIESDDIRELVEADFLEAEERRSQTKAEPLSKVNGYAGGIASTRIGRIGAA